MSETMERPADSMADDINAAWDELEKGAPETPEAEPGAPAEREGAQRDDRGRFVSNRLQEEPGKASEGKTEAAPAESPVSPPPASWSEAERAHWAALPEDARQAVLRRERDIEQAIRAKAEVDPIEQVLAPHRQKWAMQGIAPEKVVSNYLAVEDALSTNFERALPDLIRMFGRDPVAVARAILGPQAQAEGTQGAQGYDPRVDQLIQQQQAWLAQQQEERERSAMTEIEKFARAPENVYFEDVRRDMAWMMQNIPDISMREAYDRAVWANPTTRAAMMAKARVSAPATPNQGRPSSVRDTPTSPSLARNDAPFRENASVHQDVADVYDFLARG